MTTISSISELLSLSNCQYRVFDLGRKIEKISKDTFDKIEQCQIPHPFPFQGHAHFAITFWQSNAEHPYIWFIKIALDERGLLNQGTRNHFISIIIEALGTNLSVDPTEKQEELLKSNPYLFEPSQYKLAMFNSLLSVSLKKNASQHYDVFSQYLSSENFENWQQIGVQGITDFAARLSTKGNDEHLASAFEYLPFEVLSPLCGALENCQLPLNVLTKIIHQLEQSPKLDPQNQQMLLRSLASSTEHPFVKNYFSKLLAQESLTTDIVITIAGRCWQVIDDQTKAMQFLEHVVKCDTDGLFPAIFKDLVSIPTLRPLIFQCMRSQERSDNLAKAIGLLFTPQS